MTREVVTLCKYASRYIRVEILPFENPLENLHLIEIYRGMIAQNPPIAPVEGGAISGFNGGKNERFILSTIYSTVVPFDETTTNEHNGGTIECPLNV